jgi:hypothetical protein
MQYLWTGKWPTHRSPMIQQTISAKTEKATDEGASDVFQVGATIRCTIVARDPEEGDPSRIKWDVLLPLNRGFCDWEAVCAT